MRGAERKEQVILHSPAKLMKSLAQNNPFYEWWLKSTVYTVGILLNKQTWS